MSHPSWDSARMDLLVLVVAIGLALVGGSVVASLVLRRAAPAADAAAIAHEAGLAAARAEPGRGVAAARREPRAHDERAGAVDRGARRQARGHRHAAGVDEPRAGARHRAAGRVRGAARREARRAPGGLRQQRDGTRRADPHHAGPARGAVEQQGPRPVGRAHGGGRAQAGRLRRGHPVPEAGRGRRWSRHPRLHVPAAARRRPLHGRQVPARQLPALPRRGVGARAAATPGRLPPRRPGQGQGARGTCVLPTRTPRPWTASCSSSRTSSSTGSSRSTTARCSTRRSSDKIVMCSPLTLFAVLAVVRQAVDSFRLERTTSEILDVLGSFSKQWDGFVAQMDTLGKRLESTASAFDQLVGTRRRQLERQLDRIEDLRTDQALALTGGGGAAAAPRGIAGASRSVPSRHGDGAHPRLRRRPARRAGGLRPGRAVDRRAEHDRCCSCSCRSSGSSSSATRASACTGGCASRCGPEWCPPPTSSTACSILIAGTAADHPRVRHRRDRAAAAAPTRARRASARSCAAATRARREPGREGGQHPQHRHPRPARRRRRGPATVTAPAPTGAATSARPTAGSRVSRARRSRSRATRTPGSGSGRAPRASARRTRGRRSTGRRSAAGCRR